MLLRSSRLYLPFMPKLDAAYFDQWYADIAESPARDRIVQQLLGLPSELESTGLLGWEAIGEVVPALGLMPGQVLLDLACGRGGYGLEIARRGGARVIGVDFSSVAIRQAHLRAAHTGMADRAEFRVGELGRTGLAPASVDVVLCVDSIQFSASVPATLAECRRVLVADGRLAITGWEPVDPRAERLPPMLRHVDLANQLHLAGFEDIQVLQRPRWKATEQAMGHAVAAIDAGDDAALRSIRDEARQMVALSDDLRRVFAVARRPA